MNAKLRTAIVFAFVLSIATAVLRAQQPAQSDIPSASSAPDKSVASNSPVMTARDVQEQRARVLMAQKRYDAGIQAYEELLKTEPKNAVYLNMIGIAYLNTANFDQSKKYFARSAKADKKYSSAVNNLGMVYYEQKDYRRAVRQYQKAAAIDPNQAGSHANLGFAYYKMKKFAQSAAEFHKALEIDPHSLDRNDRVGTMVQDRTVENHGMFFYMMAREYARMGDAEHCADYLRKSHDEGYKDVVKAQTDPGFKKVLNDPAVQAVLAPLLPGQAKPGLAAPGT